MKVPLSLLIGYLNVDGLHRKCLGCKIPHIKELIIHDITIISETWSCNHSKDIQNYSYFQIEPQKSKQTKSGRSSGGIIVYYESFLESYKSIIKRDNQYGWLKISKSLFNNLNNDIYLCFLYNAPTSSRYYDDNFFDNLSIGTLNYCDEESRIIFIGDFNGRVSNLVDHIKLDDIQTSFNLN